MKPTTVHEALQLDCTKGSRQRCFRTEILRCQFHWHLRFESRPSSRYQQCRLEQGYEFQSMCYRIEFG